MTFMMTKKIKIVVAILALPFAFATGATALASGGAKKPEHQHWHFAGPFGTYDKDAVQRGFQVYKQVCAQCHSLKFVAFRNLGQKGGPFYVDKCPAGAPENIDCSDPNQNPAVKAIAAEYEITDGPDDSGDMFTRPGVPADHFPNPYANQQLAILANGSFPPDLSLMAKARNHGHGADYIYALLTGYEATPEEVEIGGGTYYNPYFPGDLSSAMKPEYLDENGVVKDGHHVPIGGVLKMKAPLVDGIVDYADPNTPETVEQYSKDVAEFLTWAAEPKMEERKHMGIIMLIYLIIFAGIVYASYRQIWSRTEH